MHGPIPKDIGNLNKLSMLFLSECGLTGSLPQSLSKMVNLTVLFVSLTSHTTPSQHCHLSSYNREVYNNSLSGTLPDLSNQKKLKILFATHTKSTSFDTY